MRDFKFAGYQGWFFAERRAGNYTFSDMDTALVKYLELYGDEFTLESLNKEINTHGGIWRSVALNSLRACVGRKLLMLWK